MDRDLIRATYESASSKASEVARQLAFAGVAIVWLFSGATMPKSGGLQIENSLLRAGFFLVLCLALDFAHAVYRAAAWGIYGWYLDTKHGETDDAPAWINYPSNAFYWGKLLALGVAYVLLTAYLGHRLG
jgi:hypothetical protein